jgi:hypothetical protein
MSTSEKPSLDPMNLEIDEITICVSLSTGTSPPNEEYSAFLLDTKVSNLGFELWWAGGVTALLTIQPQVGSHLIPIDIPNILMKG